MNNDNTNDKYICEEFCYHRDLKTFPSQLFAEENINYILSEIKNKPRKLKKAKWLSV